MRIEDARVAFRLPRENLVGSVETLLRRSWLEKLLFETPLFAVCLWAARRYYDAWLFSTRRVLGPRARPSGVRPSVARRGTLGPRLSDTMEEA